MSFRLGPPHSRKPTLESSVWGRLRLLLEPIVLPRFSMPASTNTAQRASNTAAKRSAREHGRVARHGSAQSSRAWRFPESGPSQLLSGEAPAGRSAITRDQQPQDGTSPNEADFSSEPSRRRRVPQGHYGPAAANVGGVPTPVRQNQPVKNRSTVFGRGLDDTNTKTNLDYLRPVDLTANLGSHQDRGRHEYRKTGRILWCFR